MSEYSIIEFLKSLSDSSIEKDIIELIFTDINEEDMLDQLLDILKENE